MPIGARRVLLGVAFLTAACSGPLGSEAGLPVPTDPGAVVVSVRDQADRPIPDVNVQVHDIPNSVGSTYSVGQRTDANGTVAIAAIPAGRRRVEVTPPPGFNGATSDLIKSVDVVKNATVAVSFVLIRS